MPALNLFLTASEVETTLEALQQALVAVPTDDLDALNDSDNMDLTTSHQGPNKLAEIRRETIENLISIFRETQRVIELRNELSFREQIISSLNPPAGYAGPKLERRE